MRLVFLFFLCSNFLIGQTWTQLADFPGTERDDGVAVRVNNKAYFGTGLLEGFTLGKDFYAYDFAANTWSAIASMPNGSERQYACAFTYSNSFYVFSGSGYSNAEFTDLKRYDVATNSWTNLTGKPGNGLFGAVCMEFGDKVIIAGGKFQNNTVSNEVWEYSINTDTWLQKNNFPFGGRWRAGATVLNNVGYLIFGLDNNGSFRKEMYSYLHATDTWTKVMDFVQPNGRIYPSLRTANNRLVLFGGYDTLNVYYNDVWYYNDASGLWQIGPYHPSFGRKGGMSFTNADKYYYSCGINVNNLRLKETWAIDIPVGIKENYSANETIFYPNPANDVINFTSKIEGVTHAKVQLFNLLNELLSEKEITFNNAQTSINTAALPNGVYFVKVLYPNKIAGVSSAKIVISR